MALLFCGGFAALYGALSLLRYHTFHSRSLDMAYYVRLVWGMAHGRPDNPVVDAPHWLGLHLEPGLLLLAAVSRLGLPIADLLLVVQAVAAALSLLPLWSLARRRLASVVGEAAALAAALSIYLVPTVSRCLDYDFHPTTVLLGPLAAWIDAVDAGRGRASWVWLLLSLSLREDVGLQIAAAALAVAALPLPPGPPLPVSSRRGQRRRLLLQAGLGIAWFAGYALWVQPRFLPVAASGSFGAHFERFGGGEGGVAGILGAALRDPAALLAYLVSADRPLYPAALLATVGGVAVLSPRWLAGALPIVGINLLSDFRGVRAVQSHYATAMAPFLVASAIEGAATGGRWLLARGRALSLAPTALLVGAAAASFWTRGAAPGAPDFTLDAYRPDDGSRAARARLEAIGDAPSVVAEVRLLAHLAERPEPRMEPAQRTYWKPAPAPAPGGNNAGGGEPPPPAP